MNVLPSEKEKLIADIKDMRSGSFEQMALITQYGLASYFKSLLAFGRRSSVTRDNLNVIKEMYRILRQENKLLTFVLKNIELVDFNAALYVIGMLDELNDKTVTYYYEVIEDIEDACECQEEHRGIRPRKNFDTLIQSKSYTTEVIALAENMNSIKNFLGYEEAFWNFISPIAKTVNVDITIRDSMSYVLPVYDSDGMVSTISLLVPDVVDLNSALLCIKLYEEAYRIYKAIGKPYERQKEHDTTIQLKYEFEYLPSKADKVIK